MIELNLTKGYKTKVCECHYHIVKNYKWSASVTKSQVKAIRGTTAGGKSKTYLMNREIMNALKGYVVDHIDGDSLNNQCYNLRVCTQQQNLMNIKIRKDNTSGHKGVHWYKQTNRWQAQISYLGKKIHLGFYKNKSDAISAYENKANELFGEFRRI
jgi:hypothetical protein